MQYRVVDKSHAPEIARLAVCLTNEIVAQTGVTHFDVDVTRTASLCEQYIEGGLYHVVAAFESEKMIGFGAICESCALYAQGSFGIVQELYVIPEYRSKEVGKSLVEVMLRFARQRGWVRLELCTPPVPEFQRTVDFYLANGFEVTGGYKMKYVLT